MQRVNGREVFILLEVTFLAKDVELDVFGEVELRVQVDFRFDHSY